MTIKQQGGIFGRNPSFNNVEVKNLTAQDVGGAGVIKAIGDATNNQVRLERITDATGFGYLYANSGQVFGVHDGSNYPFMVDQGAPTGAVNILSNGNVSIGSGNVVVSNGKGIDFSATSGTGTSELFDDYEEGTHVVTATPETSGTLTLDTAFDRDTFRYTKIGQRVFVAGALQFSAVGSPVGTWFSVSLPFAVANVFGNSDYSIGLARQTNTGSLFGVTLDGGQSVAKVLLDPSTISTGGGGRIYINFDYVT